MSDVYIFGVGCVVSLFVACAVGLLLWGASKEPRGSVLPTKKASEVASPSRPTPPAPAMAQGLKSKSPA